MIKSQDVYSFINSCKSVAESFGMNVEEGEIEYRKSPIKANTLVVVVGLTGDLHGQAMISMEVETACYIASVMMGGGPAELDETTKSAIAELTNMIIGNSVTLLSTTNIMIDITPPSVLTGDNIQISTASHSIVSVPLTLDEKMKLDFSLIAKEIEN